jgi:GAG-pre-integrase domain
MKDVQCYYCHKYGHLQANYFKKQRENSQATFAETKEEEIKLFMAQISEEVNATTIWYLDSRCSNHMSGYIELFTEIDTTYKNEVKLGDDKIIQVQGKGTVAIPTSQSGFKHLQNVYFIPELSQNLLSIGQLIESGYSIVFEGKSCKIRDKDKLVIEVGMVRNRLFSLEITKISDKALTATTNLSESELWHLRYGHLSIGGLRLLKQKQMVYGLPEISEFGLCEGCILGKHSKLPFVKGQSLRATQLLELVHTDLCGPMDTSSLGESRYFLLFIDDFSRMNWVYFLQTKVEAFECFKKFKAMVETQSGLKIKKIRSDRGGEY